MEYFLSALCFEACVQYILPMLLMFQDMQGDDKHTQTLGEANHNRSSLPIITGTSRP